MANLISPGINVSEIDQTTVVPAVLTTAGGLAGNFTWGPADQLVLVDNELTLVNQFGQPNNNTANTFFTAANFLAYGNNLTVVRSVGAGANNATVSGNIQIKNRNIFESTILNTNQSNAYGSFMAKYPGALGNSLEVSVCDSNGFSAWAYKGYFQSAPGTSAQAAAAGGSNDELHIVVIDQDGLFTGVPGEVLETFGYLSKATDATLNGQTNYYKQVLFNQSQYVYAVDPVQYSTTANTQTSGYWGQTSNTTFTLMSGNTTVSLVGGVDVGPTDANLENSYALFANKDTIDVSLILTGGANTGVQNYVITSVAQPGGTGRGDCLAFVSPPQSAVVNNTGSEVSSIQTWLSSLNAYSSYAVADSGWKYQFDKYNNVYRWVPLNGDVAGLCVYTDTVRDPWFSPAGFNRGSIKNCIKLSWNPNQAQRDTLYATGVNPVVTFPGQGTILFGDKTLLNRPNAFDRINVRRLFIVLEKSISKAAQSSLFELNDDFTRAQFVSIVTPFLRDVQGRRGITDFKVICDTTNNTAQVIDNNQFVGDIYVKPARSINYIQLNFVAVATGVDFTTVVGAA
jgi:Phage tail sheath protein subtilisin-like domain/Phage tail sheath C-terminal domain